MKILVKRKEKNAILPTRESVGAAGFDIYACINNDLGEVTINPHETVMIGTGLCMAPPEGYYIGIYARSGLSSKEGLRPANCTGICDEDYRGEYKVALHNDSNTPRTVKHGARIAQIILEKRNDMEFVEVDELDNTERGAGGFGSTGK